jgi:DNA-directed RNA polymerase subunit N (RpoN/RPB10)
MIIPIRCFTCGKVLADKWQEYEKRVKEAGDAAGQKKSGVNAASPGGDPEIIVDSYRGKVLDDLGLKRICCRRHMLTHVDLIDII